MWRGSAPGRELVGERVQRCGLRPGESLRVEHGLLHQRLEPPVVPEEPWRVLGRSGGQPERAAADVGEVAGHRLGALVHREVARAPVPEGEGALPGAGHEVDEAHRPRLGRRARGDARRRHLGSGRVGRQGVRPARREDTDGPPLGRGDEAPEEVGGVARPGVEGQKAEVEPRRRRDRCSGPGRGGCGVGDRGDPDQPGRLGHPRVVVGRQQELGEPPDELGVGVGRWGGGRSGGDGHGGSSLACRGRRLGTGVSRPVTIVARGCDSEARDGVPATTPHVVSVPGCRATTEGQAMERGARSVGREARAASAGPCGTVPTMSSHPGPAALGRGVVVGAGQAAPDGWSDAPRVVVDDAALADPGPLVRALHTAWLDRTPVVVELQVDPQVFRRPESVVVEPCELRPRPRAVARPPALPGVGQHLRRPRRRARLVVGAQGRPPRRHAPHRGRRRRRPPPPPTCSSPTARRPGSTAARAGRGRPSRFDGAVVSSETVDAGRLTPSPPAPCRGAPRLAPRPRARPGGRGGPRLGAGAGGRPGGLGQDPGPHRAAPAPARRPRATSPTPWWRWPTT